MAALVVVTAFFVVAWIAGVLAEGAPKAGPDSFARIPEWLSKPPNPWFVVTSGMSALGAVSALTGFFASKPATSEDVEHIVAGDGRQTRTLVEEGIANTALQGVESERRDAETSAKLDEILKMLKQQGGVGGQQLETAAQAVQTLAKSASPRDREIAAQITDGGAAAVYESLIAEAAAGKRRNAERYRQAARIIAPFAPGKAREAYREAIDLDPEDVWSWIEFGRLQLVYASISEARHCFEAALQRITGERDRAVIHTELGSILLAEGELWQAREEFEAGLAIAKRLAALKPQDPGAQRDLSVSYERLAQVERASGNLAAARKHCEAGLAIAEQLAAQEQGDVNRQNDLSIRLEHLGDIELASGNLDAARSRFEAKRVIDEHLVTQEPGNTKWRRDLSVSYNKLGDVEGASDNWGAARTWFEADLAIAEALAKQEPDNTEWQRDLTVSYNKLGDVELASGGLGAARERYKEGLAIRERLAALEPGNAEWQRDLTVSYNKLGDVELASGGLGAARERYEAGLAIRERLAALEPDNAEWQRDLFASLYRVARVDEADGNPATAIAYYERAEAIAVALVARAQGHPGYAEDLAGIRAVLSRLRG